MNNAEMIKWFRLDVAQDDMIAQHDLAQCHELEYIKLKDILQNSILVQFTTK